MSFSDNFSLKSEDYNDSVQRERSPSETIKHYCSPLKRQRKNSDYGLDNLSYFRVTIDKDSTTVTDMGASGLSFIEVRKGDALNRSQSYSQSSLLNETPGLAQILPFIHQYRRVMRASDTYSDGCQLKYKQAVV